MLLFFIFRDIIKIVKNKQIKEYFVDLYDRPCEQLEHDMKLWWVHNEALIATILAYKLTKDEKYLDSFMKIHEYSFNRN